MEASVVIVRAEPSLPPVSETTPKPLKASLRLRKFVANMIPLFGNSAANSANSSASTNSVLLSPPETTSLSGASNQTGQTPPAILVEPYSLTIQTDLTANTSTEVVSQPARSPKAPKKFLTLLGHDEIAPKASCWWLRHNDRNADFSSQICAGFAQCLGANVFLANSIRLYLEQFSELDQETTSNLIKAGQLTRAAVTKVTMPTSQDIMSNNLAVFDSVHTDALIPMLLVYVMQCKKLLRTILTFCENPPLGVPAAALQARSAILDGVRALSAGVQRLTLAVHNTLTAFEDFALAANTTMASDVHGTNPSHYHSRSVTYEPLAGSGRLINQRRSKVEGAESSHVRSRAIAGISLLESSQWSKASMDEFSKVDAPILPGQGRESFLSGRIRRSRSVSNTSTSTFEDSPRSTPKSASVHEDIAEEEREPITPKKRAKSTRHLPLSNNTHNSDGSFTSPTQSKSRAKLNSSNFPSLPKSDQDTQPRVERSKSLSVVIEPTTDSLLLQPIVQLQDPLRKSPRGKRSSKNSTESDETRRIPKTSPRRRLVKPISQIIEESKALFSDDEGDGDYNSATVSPAHSQPASIEDEAARHNEAT